MDKRNRIAFSQELIQRIVKKRCKSFSKRIAHRVIHVTYGAYILLIEKGQIRTTRNLFKFMEATGCKIFVMGEHKDNHDMFISSLTYHLLKAGLSKAEVFRGNIDREWRAMRISTMITMLEKTGVKVEIEVHEYLLED